MRQKMSAATKKADIFQRFRKVSRNLSSQNEEKSVLQTIKNRRFEHQQPPVSSPIQSERRPRPFHRSTWDVRQSVYSDRNRTPHNNRSNPPREDMHLMTESESPLGRLESANLDDTSIPAASDLPKSFNSWKFWGRMNVRGMVSWTRWNGKVWSVRTSDTYKRDICVLAAEYAVQNLRTLRKPWPETIPAAIYRLLESYYMSQLAANRRLLPLVQILNNLSIICFMLRTAPASIRESFMRYVERVELTGYSLRLDLEDLRFLRTTLALLPHSPLLFRSHVMTLKASSADRSLRAQLLFKSKSHRFGVKRTLGFFLEKSTHDQEAQELQSMVSRLLSVRSVSWQSKYPFVLVEPFRAIVWKIMRRFQSVVREFQITRRLSIRILGTSENWPQMSINHGYTSAQVIMWLVEDLAVLQYYRAQHFPRSFAKRDLCLNRAFGKAWIKDMHQGSSNARSNLKKRARKQRQLDESKHGLQSQSRYQTLLELQREGQDLSRNGMKKKKWRQLRKRLQQEGLMEDSISLQGS